MMSEDDVMYRQQVLRTIQDAKEALNKLESQVKESHSIPTVAEAIMFHSPSITDSMKNLQQMVSSKINDHWDEMSRLLIESSPSSYEECQNKLDALAKAPIFARRVLSIKGLDCWDRCLLHLACVCYVYNPPAKLVEIMLDLTKNVPLGCKGEDAEFEAQIEKEGCNYEWKDSSSKTPLHLLTTTLAISPGAVKVLLDADTTKKTLTMKDNDGNTPLLNLTLPFPYQISKSDFSAVLRLLVNIRNSESRRSLTIYNDSGRSKEIPLKAFWDNAKHPVGLEEAVDNEDFVYLLKATCLVIENKFMNVDHVPRLYAVLKCAPYLIDEVALIVKSILCSEQGITRQALDSNGNTALHMLTRYDLFDGYMLDRGEELPGMRLDLIHCILQHDPGAVRLRNSDGNLPLQVALISNSNHDKRNEKDNVCKALIKAYPDSIDIVDERTGLSLFLLACEGDDACLTTLYSLLRECPWLIPTDGGNDKNDDLTEDPRVVKEAKLSG